MLTKRPKKAFTIIDAIQDRDVFGSLPAFQSLNTWKAWTVWLKSIFAISMNPDELEIYRQSTGRHEPPSKSPSEIYTIVGRRGGKSFISSLTACFIACFSDFRRYLNAGEKAAILILARDRDQAKIVFNYVSGILRAIPALTAMLEVERADEIELTNDVIIMVKTSDFRAIRGLTVAAAILDEVAFWDSEGISPDREVLTALRPATSTIPNAKLVVISTPYSQAGSLYEAHRDHYGVDDELVLVWQADTRTMNPTIDEGLIQRELERDPEGAQAEWLATFRTDLQAAFSPESLEACVIKGRDELPASPLLQYAAFADPSGGRSDSFSLAIAHMENDTAILDLLEVWAPPFDPGVVVAEAAEVLKRYGCLSVIGDNYGGEWPVASFRNYGIAYTKAEKHKSELYLNFIPVVNAKQVELLDNKRAIDEFRKLERRRGRLGKDSIDHPARLHDDSANAVAGVVHVLKSNTKTGSSGFNPLLHVAPKSLKLVLGDWPLFVGLSSRDRIVATVIGQAYNAEVRIFAAFLSEGTSVHGHCLQHTRPWLTANAGSLRLLGSYEDVSDIKVKSELYNAARTALGGEWASISSPWENRRDAMLNVLTQAMPFTFRPALQIDPAGTLLSRALSQPYEKESRERKDGNYHVIDAFCLAIARCELWKKTPRNPKPPVVAKSWLSA